MPSDGPTILGGALTVDLGAMTRNWKALDAIATGALTAAVVKADAYGTGIAAAGRTLFSAGARFFFVATPDEGVALRAAVPSAHIFVLDGLVAGAAGDYAAHNLMPILSSMRELTEWLDFCLDRSRAAPAGLHFDTGFNRLGFRMDEVDRVAAELERSGFEPQVIMSHLACADIPGHEKNRMQAALFKSLRARFPEIPASLANSAATMISREHHYQMVRPGIAVYGGRAVAGRPNPMAPVVAMEVPVLQVKTAGTGETVGYGATYTLERQTRLAIVALGYADGFMRALSGKGGRHGGGGKIAVRGRIVSVLGRVSMDLVALDVTDVPGHLQPGDLVEVLGPTITIDDQADAAGTIGYEILTTLKGRFPRRYINVPDGVELF